MRLIVRVVCLYGEEAARLWYFSKAVRQLSRISPVCIDPLCRDSCRPVWGNGQIFDIEELVFVEEIFDRDYSEKDDYSIV